MLTKDDKKFILDAVSNTVSGAISKNNKIIFKEMIDLFNATNFVIEKVDNKLSNKIDQTNERIDKVLGQLRDDDRSINDHERRIEKMEEKVFITTTGS